MSRDRTLIAAVFLLPLAGAALAQSEGIAEMKGTMRAERGETVSTQGKAYLSRAGSRFEWTMDLSQIAGRKDRSAAGVPSLHREVLIYRISEPGVTYMLNVDRKTYSVIHASSSGEDKARAPQAELTVTRLGRDTVAGYSCERALLKRTASLDETEVCVSKELGPSGAWLDAMTRRERGHSLFQALSNAGLTGFPIRWSFRHSGEKEAFSTFELTRFQKTSVSASTFEIPAGYRKVSAGQVHTTPEQEEAVRKALEQMTPEQRRQYEERMKKQKEQP